MRSIRAWLSDNSAALVGFAALLTILSMILGVPFYVSGKIGSDISVRYKIIESTVPPDLNDLLLNSYSNSGSLQYLQSFDVHNIAKQFDEYISEHLSSVSGKKDSVTTELYATREMLVAIIEVKKLPMLLRN